MKMLLHYYNTLLAFFKPQSKNDLANKMKSLEKEKDMPKGKGTYGSKVGRPKKSRTIKPKPAKPRKRGY